MAPATPLLRAVSVFAQTRQGASFFTNRPGGHPFSRSITAPRENKENVHARSSAVSVTSSCPKKALRFTLSASREDALPRYPGLQGPVTVSALARSPH
jgi:hypothetical protein